MSDIHVGDVGTRLTVTLTDETGAAVDVTGASLLEMRLRLPGGGTLTRGATTVTDGSDGQISYVTQAGDLSEAGELELQAYVVLPGGAWHSDVTRFDVLANL